MLFWKKSGSEKYKRKLLPQASEDNVITELERIRKEYKTAEQAKEEANRNNIWNFIVRFCSEIESGQRRNGSERYSEGSVKSWKSFKSLYDRFDSKHKYTWQQIDRKFAGLFISFLEDNYNITSQNKHIGNIKAIINFSYRDELHDNDQAIKLFQKKGIRQRMCGSRKMNLMLFTQ